MKPSDIWESALQKLLDEGVKQLQLNSMHVDVRQVQPCKQNNGILGPEKDYEGGFVMLNITHAQ